MFEDLKWFFADVNVVALLYGDLPMARMLLYLGCEVYALCIIIANCSSIGWSQKYDYV